MTAEPLRIAFVTGASPQKWFRRFTERGFGQITPIASHDPLALFAADDAADTPADMAIVRLAAGTQPQQLQPRLHQVQLYDEAAGVAAEAEHVISLVAEAAAVEAAELQDETVLLDSIDAEAVAEMLPVAATGAGIVQAPFPLLRALAKKAVIVRKVDRPSPSSIWLVWRKAEDDAQKQEFVGVVKGRRQGSMRAGAEEKSQHPPKRTAREKTLAKQRRREAARQKSRNSAKRYRGR